MQRMRNEEGYFSMLKVEHDELQAILTQLEQASHNHEQWSRALNRTLVCRLIANQSDLRQDAHRQCLFGQWYYNRAPQKLREHPAFIAVEEAHRHMHQLAARLLVASADGALIVFPDYDEFTTVMDRMRLQLLTLKREVEDSLHNLDPLTGANSRIGMLTKLRELQELAKRRVQYCSIAMMDLDNFKVINDSYGHQIGDRVLTASTHYMLDHLRPYDTVYRYGGEEFVITMQNLDLTQAQALVERLREGLAANTVEIDGREPIHCKASFGITLLDPDTPVEHSIDRADKALYAAKSAGRNCTRVWDASM